MKTSDLAICLQSSFSLKPLPNLGITHVPSISMLSKSPMKPKVASKCVQSTDIFPQPLMPPEYRRQQPLCPQVDDIFCQDEEYGKN